MKLSYGRGMNISEMTWKGTIELIRGPLTGINIGDCVLGFIAGYYVVGFVYLSLTHTHTHTLLG